MRHPLKRHLRLLPALLLPFLSSCGQKIQEPVEIHEGARDNIVEAHPVSIDDKLPALNNLTNLHLLGDTLIFEDHQSTDKIFFAYNLATGDSIGWFGTVGQGPGEVINFGGVYFNPATHRLYGQDGGSFEYKYIDVDAALQGNDAATPFSKFDLIEKGVLTDPFYVNDTTVLGKLTKFNFETRKQYNEWVRFNPVTTQSTPFGEQHPLLEKSFIAEYDPAHNLIYVAGTRQDFLQIYDFDGHLKKTIYGAGFTDTPERNFDAFSGGTIDSKGNLYVKFNGRDVREGRAHDLLVYSPDGKYQKTIRFDVAHLGSVVYYKPQNRIYFSCDGDPQFGYINLDEY